MTGVQTCALPIYTGYYGDFPNFTDARSSETDRLLQAFKGFEGMNVRVTIEELQELP